MQLFGSHSALKPNAVKMSQELVDSCVMLELYAFVWVATGYECFTVHQLLTQFCVAGLLDVARRTYTEIIDDING